MGTAVAGGKGGLLEGAAASQAEGGGYMGGEGAAMPLTRCRQLLKTPSCTLKTVQFTGFNATSV